MRLSVVIRSMLGLAGALALGVLWPSGSAQAQSPCSGAPGERMVGMTQAGPGVAAMPLCMRDSSGGDAGPARSNDSYASIAWHPDASDIWIDGNYLGPGESVDVALEACNRAMGGGCASAGEWNNSSMAVIRDRNGAFYVAWLGEGGRQRQRVLDECSSKQPLPCEVVRTVNSRIDRYWPGPEARVAHAAAAWVDGTDGYDRKLYVASGYRTGEEVSNLALAACSAANPKRKCVVTAQTGGGFIQAATLDGERDFATVETNERRAHLAAERLCRQNDRTASCSIQAVFNSRVRGQFVHDFSTWRAR